MHKVVKILQYYIFIKVMYIEIILIISNILFLRYICSVKNIDNNISRYLGVISNFKIWLRAMVGQKY